MTSTMKNILILIFFIMFFSWIDRAEAVTEEEWDLLCQMQGDSAYVNLTDLDKCFIRYHKCGVA